MAIHKTFQKLFKFMYAGASHDRSQCLQPALAVEPAGASGHTGTGPIGIAAESETNMEDGYVVGKYLLGGCLPES
jgi:hypothetical protein